MLGAIAGDIIGSVYEGSGIKRKDIALFTPQSTFTDDSVLTLAVADAILNGRPYGPTIRDYAERYPHRGYGPSFVDWITRGSAEPYNSFGNGSAMRVSPVGHAFDTEDKVLEQARRSAECTHNHPEGIKGAQAIALGVRLARDGADKEAIRQTLQERFAYDLSRRLDDIRPGYVGDITCQGSAPEAVIAFLDATDFEDAVRNAISLGGDADTQACMAGALAEAFYRDIPGPILREVRRRLEAALWEIARTFYGRYGMPEIVRQLDAL